MSLPRITVHRVNPLNFNDMNYQQEEISLKISELRVLFFNQVFGDRVSKIYQTNYEDINSNDIKLINEIIKAIKERLVRKGYVPSDIHKAMTTTLKKWRYTESYNNFHRNMKRSNVVQLMQTITNYEDIINATKGRDVVEFIYSKYNMSTLASRLTLAQVELVVYALGFKISRQQINRIKQKLND